MIRCESSIRGWNPETLQKRLRIYQQYDPTELGEAALIRGVYTDRLESNELPSRDEFACIGLNFDLWKLKGEEEHLSLGEVVVERFRIEQRIGMGKFGIVYRATDLVENRTVAVKTIRITGREAAHTATSLLQQEAEMLSRLQRRGIPKLVQYISDRDGYPVLIREFVDGRTLCELRQQGPLPPERAAKIVARLAETLQFAHRRGYLHRDLSASNVLIDSDDVPFLTDLGLGVLQEQLLDEARHSAGTRGYMSIESRIGATREMDARDDIWSLGIILFELLTGQALPASRSPQSAFLLQRTFEKALDESGPSVPLRLRLVCARCAADNADDRYDTAGIVSHELCKFLGESLPHVDGDKVELAKRRLLTWRAGISYGKAYRSCEYVRRRMDGLVTETTKDLETAAVPLQLMFSSEKGLLDEFVKFSAFAGELGAEVPKVPFIPEFIHVYNNLRSHPDAAVCKWLSNFNDGMSGILSQSLTQLRSQAETDGKAIIALLKIAAVAGSQGLGKGLPEEITQLTLTAGLPQESTARYIACISSDPSAEEHEREVERLTKSVERELAHQLADAMGDE
jgi:serine/threonine protein kinase